MKKISFLLFISLLSIIWIISAKKNSEVGQVTIVNGSVFLKNSDSKKKIKVGKKVVLGDEFETGSKSILEITYASGTILRLNENGNLRIEGSLENPVPKISKGEMWSNVVKVRPGQEQFKVKTPLTTAAVRGTQFNSSLAENDSSMTLQLYSGKVDLSFNSPERKEINGPSEVTLEQWIEILPGELVKMNWDGTSIKEEIGKKYSDWIQMNLKMDSSSQIEHKNPQ